MKKMKYVTLAAVTILSAALLCACSGKGESTVPEVVEVVEEAVQEEEPVQEEAVVEEASAAEESSTEESNKEESTGEIQLDEKTKSALRVMDSLLMCMCETEYTYEPENPEFFWSALFYTIGNYGYLREGPGLIESDGVIGVATAYYRVVQEYATGLFEDYNDLLEIPADMSMVYVNPEDGDQYCFLMGDRGASAPRLTSWTDNGDGTYHATAEIYGLDDKSIIVKGEFTLIDNPYLDAFSDPIFYYTVRDAKIVE